MAKMIEITLRSITAELEKAHATLKRAEDRLEKKAAIVNKLGCAWTQEEYREWMDNTRARYIAEGAASTCIIHLNKEDAKVNGAWFDWVRAIDDVGEAKGRIANIEARLEKASIKVDEYHEELDKIEDAKKKEELYKLEFEAEQKEWAKDGITLESRYTGLTPNGNRFTIYSNSGYTKRSLHCFTLYINGNTIFTSGEFWRCYLEIKNR